MANQTAHGIVWASDYKSFKIIGDTVFYSYAYDGPPPVQPSDLAALAAKMPSDQVPAIQALSAAVAALPQSAAPDATPAVTAAQAAILAAISAKPVTPDATPAVKASQTAILAAMSASATVGAVSVIDVKLDDGSDGGWIIHIPNPKFPNVQPTLTVTGQTVPPQAIASQPAFVIT